MARSPAALILESRMKELGIASQTALRDLLQAKGCVVSLNSISRWFVGHTAPRRAHLAALCDVLDLSAAQRDALCGALSGVSVDADEP